MNIRIIVVVIFILLIPISLVAQNDHDHQGHAHQRNEIGISPGATYSINHKEWGFGIHAHYFRTLGAHSKWSVGGGLETVLGHGKHYNISAGVKYQLLPRLSVGVLPGVVFIEHDEGDEHNGHNHEAGTARKFATHFELVYDLIEHKKFHLGPAIDYSWAKDDSHAMLGIHFAICF